MISTWHAPLADGKQAEELLVAFDQERERRLLVLPAWFDEANKMRRFTIEVMRRLDAAGIDSFLPDLPGCNDSLAPLQVQTISGWQMAATAAAEHVKATDVLALRAGALVAPFSLPGWQYAPQTGAKQLRAMVRARTIAAREAGREETSEMLMEKARREGLTVDGWRLGAAMLSELESAMPSQSDKHITIAQKQIGGAGLWLRAEPDDDPNQAAALVAIIAGEESDAL